MMLAKIEPEIPIEKNWMVDDLKRTLVGKN
jgi:hypothetical protein